MTPGLKHREQSVINSETSGPGAWHALSHQIDDNTPLSNETQWKLNVEANLSCMCEFKVACPEFGRSGTMQWRRQGCVLFMLASEPWTNLLRSLLVRNWDIHSSNWSANAHEKVLVTVLASHARTDDTFLGGL